MLKKWSWYEIALKIFNLIFYERTCLSCLEDRGPVFIQFKYYSVESVWEAMPMRDLLIRIFS